MTAVTAVVLAARFSRLAVLLTPVSITVRNKWSSEEFPLQDLAGVQTEEEDFGWGFFPYSSPWQGPRKLTVGVLYLRSGRRVGCDALVSTLDSAGTSFSGAAPAEVKIAVLERWVAQHVR